jgi:hypothetical protein
MPISRRESVFSNQDTRAHRRTCLVSARVGSEPCRVEVCNDRGSVDKVSIAKYSQCMCREGPT